MSRIVKDYSETGSVSSLIALWGFVDDHTFLTKTGALGVVYRLRGVDDECLDHADRQAIVHRFEQALRQLDESCRVYQYLLKRRTTPFETEAHTDPIVHEALGRRTDYLNAKIDSLFELDLYLVVLSEAPTSAGALASLKARFSISTASTALAGDLDRARHRLHQKAQAFATQLLDTVAPTLLAKDAAFRFFRRLVNYTDHKTDGVGLKYDMGVIRIGGRIS